MAAFSHVTIKQAALTINFKSDWHGQLWMEE
jgi:hypothetical protein